MPHVVQAIGVAVTSFIGATVSTTAGIALASAGSFAVGAAAIAVGAVLANKAISSLYEIPKMDTDASRQRTVRSTVEPQKIIYGEALVSGPIAFVGVYGSKNRVLAHAVALAGHEVNAITDIYFDNEVIDDSLIDDNGFVTSGTFGPVGNNQFNNQDGVDFGFNICKINKHLGAAGQTVDADLDSAFGSIDSSHKGTGIAYITTHWLLKDDSQEIWDKYTPNNIKALVQGRKVYDPRTTLTVYSDNPALCVADYLTNTDFGMGISSSRIDWDSVTVAANACDVLVDTPDGTDSQKRFTCNGVLFATDTHKTNINKLLSSMNGLLTYTNGTFVIRAGVYEAPTVSLTEDDLIGGVSVKTSVERSDRFNTITGTFIDPTQNHKATEFPEVFTTAARDRDNGQVLTKNIQLPMTNDRYMAQRIAHKLVQQSDQQKVVTFPTNLSGMDVAVGDRVEISLSEFNWVEKVFICLGWTLNDSGNGGINLILREDDANSYADPAVGEYSTITATGQIIEGFRGVPDPQNLSATSFNNYIQLNWTNPDNMNDVLFIEIFASPVSAWSQTFTATSGQTDFVYDRDFVEGDTFDVKLDGVALVQGTDFTVDLETKTLTLTTGATAGDILEIFNRVKIGETDGTQFIHDAATPADSISPDDTRYYWIRARAYSTGETALSVSDRNPDNDTSTVFATVGRVDFLNVSGDVVQTGDTSRTLVDRLSDIISPDDFGAVGDGETDDTAALQALAAWVYSISTELDTAYRKGHVSIRFPARRLYKITDTIDFGGEAKDDGSGAVQTGLRVHFDFNNCEIAPAPHPDTGVVSSALRMWGDNSSWKNLKVDFSRFCTVDEVYQYQPTAIFVGPDPADMSTRFASNSFSTYENIQVFDAYNGFELEADTVALFKVTWRQCDAKKCLNWGYYLNSQPVVGASTTNTFQQCHVAARLVTADYGRVRIDEPFTATAGQSVFTYTQEFLSSDDPIVVVEGETFTRSLFANYLEIGRTYLIINLGDADWNTIAGTTGVTYSVGDIITPVAQGAANTTGRVGDFSVDLDLKTITLAVPRTSGDEVNIFGVYECIQTHVPDSTNKAGIGANWQDYWFSLTNAESAPATTYPDWTTSTTRYYEDGKGWYLYGFGSTGFIGQCAIDGTNNRVAGNGITCLQFGLTISGGFHWEAPKLIANDNPLMLVQNASLNIDHMYIPAPYFANEGNNVFIGGINSRMVTVNEMRVVQAQMARGNRYLIDASGFGTVTTGAGINPEEVKNAPSSNVHGAYDVQRNITARPMRRDLGQDFGGANSTVTPATWQSGTIFSHNVTSGGSFTLNLTKDPERGSEFRAFCYNSAGGSTANVTASSTDGATIIGPTVAKGGETLVAYKAGNSFWYTRIEYTQNFGSGDPSVGDVKPVDLTVAELPSAATYEGYVVRVTDDSSYGEVLVYSDGTNWVRVNDLNPADSTGVTYVDTTNGRLGVNNDAPANQLSVGAIEASSGDQLGTVGIKSDADDRAIMIQENVGQEQWEIGVDVDGDLNFYNSGSATPSVQFLDAGGVNVTGTVTADGLVVESASATVATFIQNDGTSNPRLVISDDTNGMVIQNSFSSGTQRDLTFKRPFGQATINIDGDTGDISFYEDTGTTAKFFWDASAESLTLDNSVTGYGLDVTGQGNADRGMRVKNETDGTSARSNFRIENASGVGGNILYTAASYTAISAWANRLVIGADSASNGVTLRGSEIRLTGDSSLHDPDLVVTSSGDVGINTSSPQALLDVNGGDARINSYAIGRGSGGSSTNTVFGLEALDNNTTGTQITAIGKEALRYNTTGNLNTAVGSESLKNNTTGSLNTAVGAYSLRYNTTGTYNTGYGYGALQNNIGGGSNVAVGDRASNSNTSGVYNVAVGRYALNQNTTGGYNVAIGGYSLLKNNANYNTAVGYASLYENTTGSQNAALGMYSLYFTTSGAYNTATGMYSGYSNTTGNYNVFNGRQAGYYNTTGSLNTLIGHRAGFNLTTGSNNTIIGQITGTAGLSDTIIIGAGSNERIRCDSSGNWGIGTSSPDQILHLYDSNCIFKMEHSGNNTSRIYFSSTTDGDWGAINASNASGNREIAITPNSGIGDDRFGGLNLGPNNATIGGVFATNYGLNVYGDVGIGTTSPATALDVAGTVTADGLVVDGQSALNDIVTLTAANPRLRFIESDTTDVNTDIRNSGGSFQIGTINDAVTIVTPRFTIDHSTGDISFYEDTGTTAKFFWDSSAESLSVGGTTIAGTLNLPSTGTITWDSTSCAIEGNSSGPDYIKFTTNATERARITSAGNVGIGTSAPATELSVSGTIRALTSTNYTDVKEYGIETNRTTSYIRPTSGFSGSANLQVGNSGNLWNIVSIESDNSFQVTDGTDKRFEVQAGADAIFYDNVGVEGMRWDSSAQNLGIGISNPLYKLVVSAGGASGIEFGPAYSGTANLVQHYSRSGAAYVDAVNVAAQHRFFIGGSERARLDASGNVGIGTSSPSSLYNGANNLVVGGGSGATGMTIFSGATDIGRIFFADGTVGSEAYAGFIAYNHSTNSMLFGTGNGGSQDVTIDSSGNLGIGTSPTQKLDVNGTVKATLFSGSGASLTNVNAATLDSLDSTQFLRSDTSDTMNGNLTITNDLTAGESFFGATSYKVRINSTSSTGILEFNSTNGVIQNTGTVLGLATNSTQIVDVRAGSMQPTTDNATDLGASTKRWDNIYAVNGTIQTSDGNEKQDIEALSDAELRVAQSIKGLIRKFRFKSAVAEKGDDARIHFGVIAQDVKAAFEAEGLDATRYGCFCADVDEDGNERLGIRYDELLAFVITAL